VFYALVLFQGLVIAVLVLKQFFGASLNFRGGGDWRGTNRSLLPTRADYG
jgi:hypothetical protein